jgi:prepilin-type N-terminal cleavage/methylation domain-containing protein
MSYYKKNSGFTLIELLVTIVIASILIGAIFALLKSYRQMSSQIKSDIDTEFYVTEFIDSFSDDIASSGYDPIDRDVATLTSIYSFGKVINFTYDGDGSPQKNVTSVNITTDLNQYTRQTVNYTIKAISPIRRNSYANELGIYKSKSLFNTSSTSINVYQDALMLAGVESFQCTESFNPSPINANAATRGVRCTLIMNAYLNLTLPSTKPYTKTYNFYAKAENQF